MHQSQWYSKNKARHQAYMKAYRQRKRKELLAYYRQRRLSDPVKWKAINQQVEDKRRFGGHRRMILERDNFTCQLCGMTDNEHRKQFGRAITIDHKDGQGRYSPTKNHAPENLWVLCLPCHGRKDRSASR